MQQIVLASTNPGKIKEFEQIFAPLGINIIAQSQLAVPEVAEPFTTFVENSLHKARHCAKTTGLPALADDSGLCVNALAGAPGIYSARYAGTPRSDSANMSKLLHELANSNDRSAYFYCAVVLVRSWDDPQPIIGEGLLAGSISHSPRGNHGHGYDPIFYLETELATAAELTAERKNQISHRAQAIQALITKLQQLQLL